MSYPILDLGANVGDRPGSNRIARSFFAVAAALFAVYILYGIWLDSRLFQTIDSPSGEYSVRLFGQKERPIWLTVSVYFEVLRNGEPYWKKELFHSGDAMDVSFELAYPDSRWVQDNVLQFYRSEDLIEGIGDEMEVLNASEQRLERLRIVSNSTVLAFDIEPGGSILIIAPKAKGDHCSFWMEADFGEAVVRASDSQPKDSGRCAFRRRVVTEDRINLD